MHADALYAAILADPDEDAPRLVYADWLEEHGGAESARAELVRVQVERGRRDVLDPVQFDLAARERALLQAHGSAWRSNLPAWTRAESCWFRRGFAAKLATTVPPLVKGAAHLCRAIPLEALVLRKSAGRLGELAGCPQLGRVRELVVAPGYVPLVGAEDARALANSPHLGRLELLDLTGQDVGDEGVRALAASSGLGSLRELHLAQTAISPAGLRALADSPHRERLTVLTLSLDELGVEGVAGVGAFARLTDLLLHAWEGSGLRPVLEQVGPLRLSALRSLALSNMSPPGLRGPALSGVLPPAGLHSLELVGCSLGDGDAQELANSPRLAQLRLLSLARNSVRDAGAEALANSANLSGLVVLDLRANSFGDAGARALARSPHLRGLRLLDLDNNRIGLEAIGLLHERFGDVVRCPPEYGGYSERESYPFTRKLEASAEVPGAAGGRGRPRKG